MRSWLRQTWVRFLLAGLVATLVSLFLPSDARGVVTQVFGWIAVLYGVRIGRTLDGPSGRPWLRFSAAGALLLLAPLVRLGHGVVAGVDEPFPSPADAVAAAGYVVLIVGQIELLHLRRTEKDRDNLIDSLIVTCGLGVLAWAVVLAPYVRDGDIPVMERVINLGFTTLAFAILLSTARLAVGPGARTPSYYLLAASIGLLLVTDLVVTLQTTGQVSGDGFFLLATPIYVLLGTAAMHPTRGRIADRVDHEIRLTGWRLVLLAAALFVAPAVLVSQVGRGRDIDLPVVVAGSVLLSVLVLARLSSLVWARERTAERERLLRDAGMRLVAARSTDETNDAILLAVTDLAHGLPLGRVSIVRIDGDGASVVASSGQRANEARGTALDLDQLPAELAEGLHDRRLRTAWARPIDLPDPATEPQRHLVMLPLVSHGETRGAVLISSAVTLGDRVLNGLGALATEVSLAVESAALAEEMHRRRGERRFRALVENSSEIILVLSGDQRIGFASPAVDRILGRADAELVGVEPQSLVHDHDRERFASVVEAARRGVAEETAEVRLLHGDGSWRWFEIRGRDLRGEPEVDGLVVTARDVSDRRAAEQRLARSEARFRSLVQNSSDVVAVIDERGFFSYVSPAVTPMLGYRPEELHGANVLRLLPPEEVGHAMDLLASVDADTFAQENLEIRIRSRSGEWKHVDVTISDLRHEPAVQGIVLNARDVTLRRALEEDLAHKSLHDELTGLGNRSMFTTRVGRALARTEPRLDQVGVLFLDLDDFKEVNDSLGHHVGDQLLVSVAERVRACLRVSDTAARLGGDEFAVLLEDTYGETEVVAVAGRILAAVSEPFVIDDREITVTGSVGIALDADRSGSVEELMRAADVALYLAKERGKGRHEVFRAEDHGGAFERLEMKAALSAAIAGDELVLHYQPIVELRTGRVTGFEALVRWRHPSRGLLGPGAFIPLAEETGLIVPLGRWVLTEACAQLRAWQDRWPDFGRKVSVNLSVRQLEQPDIVDDVAKVLQDTRLDPHHLTLEITESLVMHDAVVVRERLAALKELGVSFAVDDFGTGYSSLGYIQKFPVDIIKIDRSFVDQLDEGGGTGVVRTIIDLADGLSADVVAEGIENEAQLQALIDLGCPHGQGFHYSRPVPAAEFVGLLQRGFEAPAGATPADTASAPADRRDDDDPLTTHA